MIMLYVCYTKAVMFQLPEMLCDWNIYLSQSQIQSINYQFKKKTFIRYNSCFHLCKPTAHARLMMRDEVTIQDAIVAVAVMECSMQVSATRDPIGVVLI